MEKSLKDKIAECDHMDNLATEFVEDIASHSTTEIKRMEEYSLDIGKKALETVLQELESLGGTFPYITENF